MDDLFVLLQMPTKKLFYITKKIKSESSIVVPHTNRVYYFAENFEVWIYYVFFYDNILMVNFINKFALILYIIMIILSSV